MVDMKLGKPWFTQQIHTNTHMSSQISPGMACVNHLKLEVYCWFSNIR